MVSKRDGEGEKLTGFKHNKSPMAWDNTVNTEFKTRDQAASTNGLCSPFSLQQSSYTKHNNKIQFHTTICPVYAQTKASWESRSNQSV